VIHVNEKWHIKYVIRSLTSSALDFEDTLLASVLLEGTDKRGRNRKDSPLTISRRTFISRWEWCIHHCLVAFRYRGAIGREIERSHDFRRGGGKGKLVKVGKCPRGMVGCFFFVCLMRGYNIYVSCISCQHRGVKAKYLIVWCATRRRLADRRRDGRVDVGPCKHRPSEEQKQRGLMLQDREKYRRYLGDKCEIRGNKKIIIKEIDEA
jgi:hypothetical protein